ncbi:ABC transporter permease [Flagellimonas meridianipacifica]|uniref:Putative permease n=1 Tax=Flagellimonas meridianipacifica TaxID=1080225 RepID=A0A2T0MGY1_9FLAO|nr:ABC transporter permease [Allomuricauda pacifica]PRX56833.1 putative permease [Allomuricauda pacifica]
MIRNYFKIAWRNLKKRKGFTLINIVGLALGFACSSIIFLFVQYHLEFDKFHNHPDRIYRFVTESHGDEISYIPSVPPGFTNTFRSDFDYAEKVAKIVNWEDRVIFVEESNIRLNLKKGIVFAQKDFFDIFNFPLLNGSNDVNISEVNTAVITESMAKRLFGDSNPVNKTFELGNQETITITGVLKDQPAASFLQGDIFISFDTLKRFSKFMGGEEWWAIGLNLQSFARLHPGQDVSQIEAVLKTLPAKYRPDEKNLHQYKLQSLSDVHFDQRYNGHIDIKVLWVFALIGLLILIIACINFINISTAQSSYRSKEVGVRKVLGGLRGHLFWQFMCETFLIVIFALIVGVIICGVSLPYFNTIFELKLHFSSLLNPSFLVFIGILLVVITFLSGIYPGILLARINPVFAFKRILFQNTPSNNLTRKVLVTSQFVISIILVVSAIAINKQIQYAINSDLGFEKSAIVMVNIPKPLEQSKLKVVKQRLSRHIGIEKITACFAPPSAAKNEWNAAVRFNNKDENELFSAQMKVADIDYLQTFGLEVLEGRNFFERDSADEILVNKTFAKKIGVKSLNELLGRPVSFADGVVKGRIVGVVNDFHDKDFHQDISPIFIAPLSSSFYQWAVKVNLDHISSGIEEIEKEWSQLFPNYIFDYTFLDDQISLMYQQESRSLSLLKLFSALAIFIGSLGIYGLILFFAVQKTKEIGIRKVLGSSVGGILWIMSKDFFKLILMAGIIGSPIAWCFINSWLQNFNYRTQVSWWIFGFAISILLIITLVTISYQALKAARTNPIKCLRTE